MPGTKIPLFIGFVLVVPVAVGCPRCQALLRSAWSNHIKEGSDVAASLDRIGASPRDVGQ